MYRQPILVRLLVAASFGVLTISGASIAPAAANSATESPGASQVMERGAPPVSVAGTARDTKIVINNINSPSSYRYSIDVPAGGRLVAADAGPSGPETSRDILVEDADGTTVGAYDGAWALDEEGKPVASKFRIEGNSLVQTVSLKKATAFPVVLGLIYSDVSANGSVAATPGDADRNAAGAASLGGAFVSVPSNYVYNPALGSLHDYCTSSPDEFPAPFGPNADFRGPCARHDLCYGAGTGDFACDNGLRSDMRTNCAYTYGTFNPNRALCYITADIYWVAVVIAS